MTTVAVMMIDMEKFISSCSWFVHILHITFWRWKNDIRFRNIFESVCLWH